jgi:hypothetical protein
MQPAPRIHFAVQYRGCLDFEKFQSFCHRVCMAGVLAASRLEMEASVAVQLLQVVRTALSLELLVSVKVRLVGKPGATLAEKEAQVVRQPHHRRPTPVFPKAYAWDPS